MGAKPIDILGQRFGKLTVVQMTERQNQKQSCMWLCQCDCGGNKVVPSHHLRQGLVTHCGCTRHVTHFKSGTHFKTKTPVYRAWRGIKERCKNPHDKRWGYYGGRGITVCDRWSSFENFYADMGDPPPGTSLDRIDNNGPYSPENCRWATSKQQQRNKRNNRIVSYNGESLPISEWCEKLSIGYQVLYFRITHGWSIERALLQPIRPRK